LLNEDVLINTDTVKLPILFIKNTVYVYFLFNVFSTAKFIALEKGITMSYDLGRMWKEVSHVSSKYCRISQGSLRHRCNGSATSEMYYVSPTYKDSVRVPLLETCQNEQ
jgi:hypothetical protein